METNKLLKMLSIAVMLISLAGCSLLPKQAFIYEPPDYFKVPQNTQICVKKNFEGFEKEYCFLTASDGAFYSAKAGAALFASKQR